MDGKTTCAFKTDTREAINNRSLKNLCTESELLNRLPVIIPAKTALKASQVITALAGNTEKFASSLFYSPKPSGLADGPLNGKFHAMKTTIDSAGRLVIPKDIRRESGIKPGMPLEVRWEKGAIAITPAPLPVKLERKGRLLVAVPAKDTPRLSTDTVERTRKTLRKERSSASS